MRTNSKQKITDALPNGLRMSQGLESHVRVEPVNDENINAEIQTLKRLVDQQALVLSIAAELLGAKEFERARDAFVGILQNQFDVDRVALCLAGDDGELSLGAISQQAVVDVQSNETHLLLDVCRECLQYERIVRFPQEQQLGVLTAHRELCIGASKAFVVSVPLYHDAEPVGVLIFERLNDIPFNSETLDLLNHLSLLSASALALHMEAERSLWSQTKTRISSILHSRFGGGRYGARLLGSLFLVFIIFAVSVPLPQRIIAMAELVPIERRLVSVPFDGFVEEVMVGAGERVEKDQVLASLERHELELEGTRRDGEIASAEADFRTAMASHDRQATAVARARLEQERASKALINQRLSRVDIRAPIAGLIISGDPTDAVGAPLTKGEILFEVALADDYEVHLLVHERDIREVSEGQAGTLRLRARPGEKLELKVTAIHPVAESINGASRFRLRATLDLPNGVTPLPGESGIAHLDSGRNNLAMRFLHPIVQHLSELWWRLST